jgi:hypothetical protein
MSPSLQAGTCPLLFEQGGSAVYSRAPLLQGMMHNRQVTPSLPLFGAADPGYAAPPQSHDSAPDVSPPGLLPPLPLLCALVLLLSSSPGPLQKSLQYWLGLTSSDGGKRLLLKGRNS